MKPTEETVAGEATRGGALFRRLFDLSPVGTALVSPDNRFLHCNEAFCRYLGYAEQELVGKHCREVTYPDDRQLGAEDIRAVLAGDLDAARLEKRYLTKSGKVVWGEVCFGLVRDANGRPLHFVTVVLDITERKRAEERLRASEVRLQSILEHAPMSMAIVGMDGTIEYINRKALTTFGYSPEDIPTMEHWWVLAYPDPVYRREVIATWTALTERAIAEHREIERREYRVTCKDGTVKTMMILGVPVADKVFAMFEDLTERTRAEEALREADQRKNDFLGVLSHELRNPLTPIRNSLYILERAAPGAEQARRAHAVIDRQLGHLVRLVDDLLDVTRITRAKARLQRTRLDLVDLVRRTVEDHRTLLDNHEVAVELPDEAVWIDGDPTRLVQVLGNLLNNAAKFTAGGGKISVSLGKAQGRAVLEVADTGTGIDPATLKRLFEPFAQADRSLDRTQGGLGLGLALVKGLVELHGGEVSAASEGIGRGARFTIKLPLDERGTLGICPPQPGEPATRERRVLVIEDNKDAADSLSEVLQLSGHRVEVAYDGDAGLAKAREFRPEVVLCDIGLPGMDGYAVARSLRGDSVTASACLVALTGYAQPEDQHRALEAGFDVHLAKPWDPMALKQLLAQAPRARVPSNYPLA
ncbi:MAG: PAS domain S-box protein [Myxococcaceae bacterium]